VACDTAVAPGNSFYAHCGHIFCGPCQEKYSTEALGTVDGYFVCPGANCEAKVKQNGFGLINQDRESETFFSHRRKDFVSAEDYNIYLEQKFEHYRKIASRGESTTAEKELEKLEQIYSSSQEPRGSIKRTSRLHYRRISTGHKTTFEKRKIDRRLGT